MMGNNSSGARSIRYGKMVDNVLGIEGTGADGRRFSIRADSMAQDEGGAAGAFATAVGIAQQHADEIASRFPKVQRRVGGYNLDALLGSAPNLPGILVGSEGTLALADSITLRLSRLPAHRVLGICQFPSFRAAMLATPALVALGPVAVELVDHNVLRLGRDIPLFRQSLGAITRGTPQSLLIVEFAGDDRAALDVALKRLDACMGDLGHADSVVPAVDPALQTRVWEMREACLNILMSMKGDAKPVSFIEDCAVPLDCLADYTEAIETLFARYGTEGTWYAHASVGCLHVRPILNLKTEDGLRRMRAIAEEAFALVRRFEGSHSGEHGDGISRSEFHGAMFGERLVAAFGEVKQAFDPEYMLNPGKIVRPYRMDDRLLLRYGPDYRAPELSTVFDWSEQDGIVGAVEMCNNNGACRRLAGGGMCPSFRATREESDSTRGRANILRLVLSGQLGSGELASPEVTEALDLCVGCKACRRECPTGVDMARLKIEAEARLHASGQKGFRAGLVAHLPAYAAAAARLRPLLNAWNGSAFGRHLNERVLGLAAARRLPRWQKPWDGDRPAATANPLAGDGRDIVIFGDCLNRYFEPENLEAAAAVLRHLNFRLHPAGRPEGRALCCGRSFLTAGNIEKARREARQLVATLHPHAARGVRIVGLEPSCLLTIREDYPVLGVAREAKEVAAQAFLIDEVLEAEDLGSLRRTMKAAAVPGAVLFHAHCHQKAAGSDGAGERVLGRLLGTPVSRIETACCGMAGAFGLEAEHHAVSMAMGELALFPAIRATDTTAAVAASGASCRSQIRDGTGRAAHHPIQFAAWALGLAPWPQTT
jgi:Fe-S oxidoreductase/FAD/FMN-containing dehydrogenase